MGSFDLEVLVESETRGFESRTKKGFFSSNLTGGMQSGTQETILFLELKMDRKLGR